MAKAAAQLVGRRAAARGDHRWRLRRRRRGDGRGLGGRRRQVAAQPRVTQPQHDGSGATFAAAVAARLALGDAPAEAIAWSKGFVGRAISDAADWRIGAGTGPIDQFGWSALTLR